jgi:ligand-binding sensor domain-containing protein
MLLARITALVLFLLSSAVFAQYAEWQNFTNGNYVQDVAADAAYMWVATTGGLVRIAHAGGAATFYNSRVTSGLPANNVTCLVVDAAGRLWTGTSGGGLAVFNGSTWQVYTSANSGLQTNSIMALAATPDSAVLAGTDGQGLVRIKNGVITVLTTAAGLPDNSVYAIAVVNGTVWVGTSYGLAKQTVSSWQNYTSTPSGLPGNWIKSLAAEVNYLWVGTTNGAARFDGNTAWQVYKTGTSGLPNKTVNRILARSATEIWLGTANGLAKFNGTTGWTGYTQSPTGLPSSSVLCLGIAPDNALWVGTAGGLATFNGSTWTSVNTSASGLPHNDILALAADGAGVWIGTDNGLAVFDGNSTWRVLDESNSGLPHKTVSAIAIGANGSKWIATGNGNGPNAGSSTGGLTVCHTCAAMVGVHDAPARVLKRSPSGMSLTAGPNPFAQATVLAFTVPYTGRVSVTVQTLTGQPVRTLTAAALPAGEFRIKWDGRNNLDRVCGAGIYVCAVSLDGQVVQTGKIFKTR